MENGKFILQISHLKKKEKIKQQELKHFSYVYRIEKNINI